MRLIDGQKIADELLGEIFERGQVSRLWEQQLEIGALTYKDIEFADGYDLALDNLYRQIRDAEEIKAIPVEWIKKYIAEEGIYPNRELLSVEQADAIERMVENWEKENERKTN